MLAFYTKPKKASHFFDIFLLFLFSNLILTNSHPS